MNYDFVKHAKEKWNDKQELELLALDIVARQIELAQLMAEYNTSFNSTYTALKDEHWKATNEDIKAKAKTIVGSDNVRYEWEFDALTNLIYFITLRVSQLSPV